MDDASRLLTRCPKQARSVGFSGSDHSRMRRQRQCVKPCLCASDTAAEGTRVPISALALHLRHRRDRLRRDETDAAKCTAIDLLFGFPIPWERAVALNTTGVFGANPRAFGHTGWGGPFGYADLEAGVGAAYVMNKMSPNCSATAAPSRLLTRSPLAPTVCERCCLIR